MAKKEAKKEIDWNLYAEVNSLTLYELINLSLGLHPEEKYKDMDEKTALLWSDRSIIALESIKNKELKPFKHTRGLVFSFETEAYKVLIKEFVRFAYKWQWKLPKNFPKNAEFLESETKECPFCHYETKLLKIQGEAIKKFWADFDPMKPGTEPKKTTVMNWLKSEYRISDKSADAIATIIRPDGLSPGVKPQKEPAH
jgi:hypothetical protein